MENRGITTFEGIKCLQVLYFSAWCSKRFQRERELWTLPWDKSVFWGNRNSADWRGAEWAGSPRGAGGSPNPRPGASPWGRAGLWGAGDWPCCGINGAGAEMGPRGAAMRSWVWVGWRESQGGGRSRHAPQGSGRNSWILLHSFDFTETRFNSSYIAEKLFYQRIPVMLNKTCILTAPCKC